MNINTNLFVYGSLRSGFHHPAYQYLADYFKLIGNAQIKGKLFDNGQYPVAKTTTEEKYIIGELYQIKNQEEFDYAIAQLDDYEGLNVEEGEKSDYIREEVSTICNNQNYKTWVYLYNGNVNNFAEIETSDVLEYLQQKK